MFSYLRVILVDRAKQDASALSVRIVIGTPPDCSSATGAEQRGYTITR